MPCEKIAGSCSLCPWCGEEQCPHLHDHDNDKRYWVYATNREESCHILMANLNTKKEVVSFVKKLANKRWGKDYKVVQYIDKRKIVRGRYKVERSYAPYVEITITDGEYAWNNSVNLLVNTDDKTVSYYNIWKTNFFPYTDEQEEMHIGIIKPWDEKLEFINMQDLPWYPTKEEWEAKRKR